MKRILAPVLVLVVAWVVAVGCGGPNEGAPADVTAVLGKVVNGPGAAVTAEAPKTPVADPPKTDPLSGAIFTTTANGLKVNGNIYGNCCDVYLNGGPGPNAPCTAAGLPDGTYYFQVTDPSGKVLLSSDAVTNRAFVVQGGVITEFLGSSGECDHQTGTGPCDSITIQLMPFDATPNPGGEFKVWVTPVTAYDPSDPQSSFGFVPSMSKTDTFKCQQQVCPPKCCEEECKDCEECESECKQQCNGDECCEEQCQNDCQDRCDTCDQCRQENCPENSECCREECKEQCQDCDDCVDACKAQCGDDECCQKQCEEQCSDRCGECDSCKQECRGGCRKNKECEEECKEEFKQCKQECKGQCKSSDDCEDSCEQQCNGDACCERNCKEKCPQSQECKECRNGCKECKARCQQVN